MEPLLDIKNLTTVFPGDDGDVVAVDDVSFSIGRGETVGLVGESGCGKSVTALSIMHLAEHGGGKIHNGQMLFDGRDLGPLSRREMNKINGDRISMVFQAPMSSLNPMLTIGTQLVETIRRHRKTDRADAVAQGVQLLESVGINQAA